MARHFDVLLRLGAAHLHINDTDGSCEACFIFKIRNSISFTKIENQIKSKRLITINHPLAMSLYDDGNQWNLEWNESEARWSLSIRIAKWVLSLVESFKSFAWFQGCHVSISIHWWTNNFKVNRYWHLRPTKHTIHAYFYSAACIRIILYRMLFTIMALYFTSFSRCC